VIAAKIDVHQAGDLLVVVGVLVVVDSLNQGGGAVAHANDCNANFAHSERFLFCSELLAG